LRLVGYLAAAAAVCAAGVLLATVGGVDGRAASKAASAAWGAQTIASFPLIRSLNAGRNASGWWIAGMVGRAAALLATMFLAAAGVVSRDAGIVFGLSLTALIIMEAVWLAAVPGPGAPRDKTRE
jgi:hypothetical protein